MQSRNWIPIFSLAILFALQVTVSNAQEAIGKATSVRPQAEGSHGGTRTLSGGADVYSKETVRTGDAGQADLQFRDNSNLTVGPKSSVRLDKFVYDPNKSAEYSCDTGDKGLVSICDGITGQGGRTRSRLPMAPLAYAVEESIGRPLGAPTSDRILRSA